MTEDSRAATGTYTIRPRFEQKFRPQVVEKLIHAILVEGLSDKQYSQDLCKTWTEQISDSIKTKLKELNLDRYKYVVQVVIGEQRGEGVKMNCRCFWDSDTDNYARDIFMNVSHYPNPRNQFQCI
ncbi:Dynein light chain Tctex-type protein 2B [Geodia barretti]|uniref:Dynein light chain Tctex-type protein 2B n=1 Tax=Geodia barretti TaxID=519541 RepID=A0AA35XG61_GEOBA|nr:Dynein light chain Tctex-type protein 2B [Geodia barretti]